MANIVVLFEVKPTKAGMKKYLDLAAMLKPLLADNVMDDRGKQIGVCLAVNMTDFINDST